MFLVFEFPVHVFIHTFIRILKYGMLSSRPLLFITSFTPVTVDFISFTSFTSLSHIPYFLSLLFCFAPAFLTVFFVLHIILLFSYIPPFLTFMHNLHLPHLLLSLINTSPNVVEVYKIQLILHKSSVFPLLLF